MVQSAEDDIVRRDSGLCGRQERKISEEDQVNEDEELKKQSQNGLGHNLKYFSLVEVDCGGSQSRKDH